MGKIPAWRPAIWPFLALALCLGSGPSARASSAQSPEQFCSMARQDFINDLAVRPDPGFDQEDDPFEPAPLPQDGNYLAFQNPRGPLGIGECWWDSLFQRSAEYLTVFRPDLPKPDRNGLVRIIKRIIANKSVVEIGGYADLADFSADNAAEITHQLGHWQIIDAFVRQKWFLGLLGTSRDKPKQLAKSMDHLYAYFTTRKFIPYLRLKLSRFEAHALLVTRMKPLSGGNGYKLEVIDSNYPGPYTVTYHYGDETIEPYTSVDFGDFGDVPYLNRTVDEKRIARAIGNYCKPFGGSLFLSEP